MFIARTLSKAGALLGLAIICGTATSAAAQYRPPSYSLGGVNLNYYCATVVGPEFKSILIGNTAGDWVCQRNTYDRRPISVDHACRLQYGIQNVRSRALNWNDPLSWRCFRTSLR